MFGIEAITKFVEEKISDFGADAIMEFVSDSPIGAAFSAMTKMSEFIESSGTSGLNELISHEAKHFTYKYKGSELIKKIQDSFEHPTHLSEWQRVDWAGSRENWLANRWRHDWRSQPRNRIGEWIVGRLPYPVSAVGIGKGKSRTSRSRRRVNRYKRYGRLAARSYSFGSSGGAS